MTFIVISGTDGSGKATQARLLKERLESEGKVVDLFDFPRYGNDSAKLVELYLNGVFGVADDVPAKVASAFYAFDRYMAREDIRKSIDAGHIVLSNRYVSANMGHQGSKIADPDERRRFFDWIQKLEYERLGVPKPDINIFLHVPHEIGQKLVLKKKKRDYIEGGKKQDIHEADTDHLRKAEATYLHIVSSYPDWISVSCTKKDRIRSRDDIATDVYTIVKKFIR